MFVYLHFQSTNLRKQNEVRTRNLKENICEVKHATPHGNQPSKTFGCEKKKNEIKKNISSLGKRLDDLLKLEDIAQVWYLKNKNKIGKGK